MRHWAHFKNAGLAGLVMAAFAPAILAQPALVREGNRWVETITGSVPAGARLVMNCEGPVHVEGGTAADGNYTAKLSVAAASEAQARRILERSAIRVAGSQLVVTSSGAGRPIELFLQTPRLSAAGISTSEGKVEANGVDGLLTAESGGGDIKCNRIRGDARLTTQGGDIQVGEVSGALHGATAGGRITVKNVRGDLVLQTAGGDIEVASAGASVRADTGGGAVRVNNAGGAVTATTGGGPIVVGRAGGIVITRNMAGPVQVGGAPGVRSESGTGGIQLSNIAGSMRVSTAVGSIIASLLGSSPFSDSFLATGNGDITVMIPSNLGVTIRAENDLADSPRRIVCDFPGVPVRMRGMQVVAEGPVNGGGPLLRISGTGGTIFIRKQQ
ncbi:MAG TPA: hypothetical protein VKT49_24410 [Bryobacteraceae bacterium]|nr:hypothetical protein [Bryobacteraceae bacterium]